MDHILLEDPELARAFLLESDRQMSKLELIASENFVSSAVREAQGSVFTHKYAEGYPGKRYYGGCEFVDIAENLAIERAKQLFGCDYVNVQPHSGSQANMASYFALAKPGDTILGMNLSHGGHLTHGSPVNFSGRLFNVVSYGVDKDTCLINYDEVRRLAHEHRPTVIVAGASAYPRTIDFAKFRAIADEVDAKLFVDMAHIAGLVAAGLHPTPIGHAHVTTTTTHKTLRGPRGGMILSDESFGKTLNSQIFPGIQGGPLMHIVAAKAVAFGEALRPRFKDYQAQVLRNTVTLGEELKNADIEIVRGHNNAIVEATIPVPIKAKGGQTVDIRICVVNGANQGLEEVLHRVRLDKNRYHFIEVMNCPGGCVNGGGQPVQPVGTAWLNPTLPLPLRA